MANSPLCIYPKASPALGGAYASSPVGPHDS